MKIGWFTPFAVGTDIAEFSAGICDALFALGHAPLIVRLDESVRPGRAFAGEVMPWRFWPHVHDADAVFYTVGDDFAEFAPVYDLLRRRPGIAIFRDASLTGYFAAHAAARGAVEPPLGAAASLERIAVEASGAVVIGAPAEADLAAACAGPVLQVPDRTAADAAAFAERLVAFAGEVAALESAVRMLAQIGDRLGDMGVPRGDPLVGRIAEVARFLFPAEDRGRDPPDGTV